MAEPDLSLHIALVIKKEELKKFLFFVYESCINRYMKLISRKESKLQQLHRYFTGVPCNRGHVAERLVVNCACVECAKITNSNHDKTERGKATRRNAERKYANTT